MALKKQIKPTDIIPSEVVLELLPDKTSSDIKTKYGLEINITEELQSIINELKPNLTSSSIKNEIKNQTNTISTNNPDKPNSNNSSSLTASTPFVESSKQNLILHSSSQNFLEIINKLYGEKHTIVISSQNPNKIQTITNIYNQTYNLSQNIITITKNSKSTLLLTNRSAEQPFLIHHINNITLEDNSELTLIIFKKTSILNINTLNIIQNENSHLNIIIIDNDPQNSKPSLSIDNYNIILNKKQSSIKISTLQNLNNSTLATSININHNASETSSKLDSRTILQNNSKVILRGNIIVKEGTEKTSGYQKEDVILLDDTCDNCEADIMPFLTVGSKNTELHHSASISSIEPKKLFYLTSRGLSKKEARALILDGFMKSIYTAINNSEIKDELKKQLRRN